MVFVSTEPAENAWPIVSLHAGWSYPLIHVHCVTSIDTLGIYDTSPPKLRTNKIKQIVTFTPFCVGSKSLPAAFQNRSMGWTWNTLSVVNLLKNTCISLFPIDYRMKKKQRTMQIIIQNIFNTHWDFCFLMFV